MIVEARAEDAFLAALKGNAAARKAGEADGYDYSTGSTVRLSIYAPVR